MYKLYADGGCAPSNPGPGGFAFRLEGPNGAVVEGWGHEDSSTNNRMEILAATHGLRTVPHDAAVELICDSQYVLNGCSQWRKGWQSRGMHKADGSPVVNAELWLALWAEADKRRVQYTWVRGHTGNPGNERVDELAGKARASRATHLPASSVAAPSPCAVLADTPAHDRSPAAKPPGADTQTMLMSLLSAKVGPHLRGDAKLSYKDTAEAIVRLLERLKWTPPA